MSKIALIGDPEFILGFRALGIELFPVATPQEALDTLKGIIAEDYGVIYITEAFASQLSDEITELSNQSKVGICIIPGREGSRGLGLERLRKIAARAIGVDIFKEGAER